MAAAPLLGNVSRNKPEPQPPLISRSPPTMPLIIISGYPSSGKTTRAHQLQSFLHSKISATSDTRISKLKVHIINTESLHIARSVYREARTEKEARATEYSAVKRVLGKDDIVITDGLNYIKGYRYQLFCEAKALLTPSCVVHVAAPADTCRLWNSARNMNTVSGGVSAQGVIATECVTETPHDTAVVSVEDAGGYPDDIFENLIFRYEEPNGMSRWDSPLFTVPYMDDAPDLEGIWEAMVGKGVKVKANQATVLKPATESDYLYELDKTTQDVVTLILEHQKSTGAGGGDLPVPECSGVLELPARILTVPQLQRIRRQFISLNRQHSVVKRRIRELFVEYVNGEFR